MKLIHCADLHLDSSMTTHLDAVRARERKAELLYTFERMVQYAIEEKVDGILIAGDLFDANHISATVRNTVWSSIRRHPKLAFFYLKGNHDSNHFFDADFADEEEEDEIDKGTKDWDQEKKPVSQVEIPNNLFLFDQEWYTYDLGKVTISGAELTGQEDLAFWDSLELSPDQINLVLLHGQEAESSGKDTTPIIPIRLLRDRAIDYLALGHVHSYMEKKLDRRGIYCYPGCLEGRGFDECGEHGFVLLEINEEEHVIHSTFVPFAKRRILELRVDISECMTTYEIAEEVKAAIDSETREEDMVKVILSGEIDVECEKDLHYIQTMLDDCCYLAMLVDQTSYRISLEDYQYDESLKGEFVRIILADDSLTEEEKGIVIRYGILAIEGEVM